MEEDTSMMGYVVQNDNSSTHGIQTEANTVSSHVHSSTAATMSLTTVNSSYISNVTSHAVFDNLEPGSPVPSSRQMPVLPTPANWTPPLTTNSFPTISFPSYSPIRDSLMEKSKDDPRAFEKHSPSFIPGVMPTIGLPHPLNYCPKTLPNQISPPIISDSPTCQYSANTYDEVQDLRKDSRLTDPNHLTPMIIMESRPDNERMNPINEPTPHTEVPVEFATDLPKRIDATAVTNQTDGTNRNDVSGTNEKVQESFIPGIEKTTLEEENLENVKSCEDILEHQSQVQQQHSVKSVEGNTVQVKEIALDSVIFESHRKHMQTTEPYNLVEGSSIQKQDTCIIPESDKHVERQCIESTQHDQVETKKAELVDTEVLKEKQQEAVLNEPDKEVEEDTTDLQDMVGKVLMDIAAKVFKGSLEQALVNIRGNILFSINTSGKNKGKSANLRINKRTPFGDLTNTATVNFGVSLAVQPPVAVRVDRTKSCNKTSDIHPDEPTIENSPVSIRGDNPYTRKRGRPSGEGRLRKMFSNGMSPPAPKLPRTRPPKKNIKYEMENLQGRSAAFMFICAHCDFSTTSDAVYKNHVKKCEELQNSGEERVQPETPYTVVANLEEGDTGNMQISLVKTEHEEELMEEEADSEPDAAEIDNSDEDYMPDEDDLPLKPKSRRSRRKSKRPRTIRSNAMKSSEVVGGEGFIRQGKMFSCEYCNYTTDHSRHIQEHVNTHTGFKPHKCDQCDKAFNKPVDLKRHKVTQHRDFRCMECDDQFDSKRQMTNHYRVVHKKNAKDVYKACKVCKKQCLSKDDLAQHIRENHEHICSICGEVFRNVTKLRHHRNEAHADEAIMCNICNKTFQTQTGYQRHIGTHTNERIPCETCGKLFTTKSSLSHHKRALHAGVKKYKCEKCGKDFNFYHSLKLHILQHEGSRPYKCEICGKSYLTANHLKNHKEGVHATEKKYKCPVCNKAFPYDNSLKLHMILHTGDRPYQCEICGKGFVSKGALKSHLATHEEGRNYVCKECGKSFKAENLLRAHWRRHTDDGSRFMCDICGLTFMYKSNLDQHSAVHGEERKYSCNQCDKTFKTMATLYSHRLVHTETTPFNCSVCAKGFKSKDRVLAHERRHSGLKPFQCSLCGNCFPDKGGLSKHMKTVHSKTKRYMCPVCGKQSNRMDNLRVHMKTHGDKGIAPVLLDPEGQPPIVIEPQQQLTGRRERPQHQQLQQQPPQQAPEQAMQSTDNNSQQAHQQTTVAPMEMARPISASPHMNQHTPTPPANPMSSITHVNHPSSTMMSDIRMAVEMAQQQHGHPMATGIPSLQSHINSAMSMIPGALGLTDVANLQPAAPMQYNIPHSQGQGGMTSTVDTSTLHMAAAHAQIQPHLHHGEWKPSAWQ